MSMRRTIRVLVGLGLVYVASILVWLLTHPPKIKDPKVRKLTHQLTSWDATDRGSAASELGNLGPRAKEAVPALVAALKDEDYYVARHVVEALVRIGPDAVPALI